MTIDPVTSALIDSYTKNGNPVLSALDTNKMLRAVISSVFDNLPVYANNAAATALTTGTPYRTSTGSVQVKY